MKLSYSLKPKEKENLFLEFPSSGDSASFLSLLFGDFLHGQEKSRSGMSTLNDDNLSKSPSRLKSTSLKMVF